MGLVKFINHTILPLVIFHMIPDKIHVTFNHLKSGLHFLLPILPFIILLLCASYYSYQK